MVFILLTTICILCSPLSINLLLDVKLQNIALILMLWYYINRGDYMENKRKSFTLRVSPELKFQIEKAATEEGFTTINSWIIHIIVKHLEKRKK